MRALALRVAALERREAAEKDFRVIETQLARAEEKVLRLERCTSWLRPNLQPAVET